jgi:hypothetical protein
MAVEPWNVVELSEKRIHGGRRGARRKSGS